MFETTLNGVMLISGCSIVFGLALGIASKKLRVERDKRIDEVINILPGANCGACGYVGCENYAEALVKGDVDIDRCVVGGENVVNNLAKILSKETVKIEKKVAVVFCNGGINCLDKYSYIGHQDCWIANSFMGGNKMCEFGCIGLGSCVRVCKFNAIKHDGIGVVPRIDYKRCTGCGECVKSCPKRIIELVSSKFQYHVMCRATYKGAYVRKICKFGCIGCKICVKSCPFNDIEVVNNYAIIKCIKCRNCGTCFEKCPAKSIQKLIYA